jgi:sugar phosphate isomerase/epimerase
MNHELAVVCSNYNKNNNPYETIDTIKETGFNNVFIEWYDKDWEVSQEEQVRYCKEKGLNIVFAHLGYECINNLWIEEETGIVDRYKKDIKDCHDNGIDLVVMHLAHHMVAPAPNELGLSRIREIVEYAKSLNVRIAFENHRINDHFYYVLNNIKDDNVGVCFDSGHAHAFSNDDLDFDLFKDRIFAVHLHDNDQTADLHLLPFDGNIDWNMVVDKLHYCNYAGPITLEIHYHRDYVNMNIKDFYNKAYESGLKVKELYEGENK